MSSVSMCALGAGCGGEQAGTSDDHRSDVESVARVQPETVPEIEFTEQTAIALPEDRLLSGAVLSPSGDLVVAWSMGHPGVRLYDESTSRDMLVADVGHAIGVEFLDENHLEIVDAASGDLVTTDTTGAVRSRRDLPGSRAATAAARTATGWMLAVAGADSAPSHVRLPGGVRAWVPESSYTEPLGLSGSGRAALVWQTLSPFRVWRTGMGPDSLPAEFEPVSVDWFDDELAKQLQQSPALWSATSVATVGPGHVQTLANRGTDDRLLIWFDERGRFVRYVHLEVPFGFVAEAAKAPVMLAMRTLNNSELVKYSWEQVSGAAVHQQEARP